jgi:SAM-dependent MidA family methyltransferase
MQEPTPGPHNEALSRLIASRIEAEGPLHFSDFMRLTLYHPERGYYICHDPALDYQSSPNVHPVFGACIARQIGGFWREMGTPGIFTIFEAGAGSGRLCADILGALRQAEPQLYEAVEYVLQDLSLTGEDARRRIEKAGVPLEKVRVAAALPDGPEIEGCIISNELLDALPFERVLLRGEILRELRVGLYDGAFVDAEADPTPEVEGYFRELDLLPGEGCEAEVNLEALRWISAAANALRRGYILTLDYGYEASELYSPARRRGTLLTFYRHTSDDDPYARVGLQDITASVDLTTVARAGESAGLRTLLNTTQAEYLAALGIGNGLLERADAVSLAAQQKLRRAVIELTDMTGLGRIRVLIQGKGV